MANSLYLLAIIVTLGALLLENVHSQSVSGVLSKKDQTRMRNLFLTAPVENDLTVAYEVVAGLNALGKDPRDAAVLAKACKTAQSKAKKDNLESLYQGAFISATVGTTCKLSIPGVDGVLTGTLSDGATSKNLYFAISALTNLNLAFDDKKAVALLKSAVESDDSASSYGMAFLAGSLLKTKEDLTFLLDSVEDVIGQADSTDTTLYYSDGLCATCTVAVGMFSLMTALNKDANLKSTDIVKLSNYILSSRYTANVGDAFSVVMAASQLANNKFYVPTAVNAEVQKSVTKGNPTFMVRVTNILDGGVGKAKVKASILDSEGNSVAKDQMFTSSDNVVYSLPLYSAVEQQPGVYTVRIQASFEGTTPAFNIDGTDIRVVVAQKVTMKTAEVSIIDREQDAGTAKGKVITYPTTSKETFSADFHQKVVIKFPLSLEKQLSRAVHQSFVRLVKKGSSDDVFFIAQQDKNGVYVFEMDVSKVGKDSFNSESGSYEVALLVGDVAMETPLQWNLGTIKLTFAESPPPRPDHKSAYKPKKEIQHLFREPEKRPPAMVSTAFTGLVLVPLGVVLIVWVGMGANLSNLFSNGLWGIGFHVGLASIFALYFCFWTQLNMFQTIKYLVLIGIPTFVAGHRLLRGIATGKKA